MVRKKQTSKEFRRLDDSIPNRDNAKLFFGVFDVIVTSNEIHIKIEFHGETGSNMSK